MEEYPIEHLTAEAVALLKRLIVLPSVSRDEARAADCVEQALRQAGAPVCRHLNNVWSAQEPASGGRPVLLLNAHLDTVRPSASWTRDPFVPAEEDGRIYGLGSNDCGGGLVALLTVYLALRTRSDLLWRLVFLASAEEEVSGRDGVEAVLPMLPPIDAALVGEPTGMRPAIAEKGLMVFDCVAHGKAGHAAREEGDNAIYRAVDDICWFRTFRFPRVSPLLGAVKMSVTVIGAGSQHNVVPDSCRYVVDVRTNELYSNVEVLDEVRRHVRSTVTPRSTRLSSSSIPLDHPLALAAVRLGGEPFGSPTLSDQALMPFPSLKMGPGESARSHTADEYVEVEEIRRAIGIYLRLLTRKSG